MKLPGVAVALVLILTSCTVLSPQAQAVRITSNPDVVRSCRFIANVRGSAKLGHSYDGQMLDKDNAVSDMKNEAAKSGGTPSS